MAVAPEPKTAVVVGAGPNGLAAAIEMARGGFSVTLFEASATVGGGSRSAELTLPRFTHDVCSAVHPLAAASRFFATLPLRENGLEWVHPGAPLAHPFDDGTAAVLHRSVGATAETLGKDAPAYERLMNPLAEDWEALSDDILAPLHVPRHPVKFMRFASLALRSAQALAEKHFEDGRARALFAGLAAHSALELDRAGTAAFGLVIGVLGHAVGWPVARGGSQHLPDALAAAFGALGGQILTGRNVASVEELPPAEIVLLDVTPRQLVKIAGARLADAYRKELGRYRYGPGVFKIDWALSEAIPWRARQCAEAGTVHVGGTAEEIAANERAVWQGVHPERPFIILAQQSLFDPSRCPPGKESAWAYCHVPNGSTADMTEKIEAHVERFAPGFRDCILARSTRTAAELEAYNANCVGGDINGGAQNFGQLFARPVMKITPYATGAKGVYICSSSTPPGGGVHGLCGYHAARAALAAR